VSAPLSEAIPIPMTPTSPLISVGPHWMIPWPFDTKKGLSTRHKTTDAYIM